MSSLLIAGGAVNFGPSTVTTVVTVAVAGACACGAPAAAKNAATTRTLATTKIDLRIAISSAGGFPPGFALTWDQQEGRSSARRRNFSEPAAFCQAPARMSFTCAQLSGCSINQGEMLAPLQPLFVVEYPRSQLDQPRQHIEHRHRTPLRAHPRTESFAVQFLGHFHQRNILNNQFHHRKQKLHLRGILLQMFAIPSDAQPERRIL